MKKEIFKKIITDFHERELIPIIERDIDIPLDVNKIVSIIGVRRSGKTFLCYSLINKLEKQIPIENILYLNFEDDRLFPIDLKDMDSLIEGYYELYPDKRNEKVYFFFDEIQNVDNWEIFLRRIFDTLNCRIYITGSSSKLLSREIATSLRGRTLVYEIFPLSFKDFLKFNKVLWTNLHSSKTVSKIKNIFDKYLKYGGFPEVVNFDMALWERTLEEYIDLILYKDIMERFKLKNTFLMKYLIKYLSKNISTLLSVSKLANDLKSQGFKISKNTLYEYISHLEDVYAFFSVSLYSNSVKEIMRNPKKVYAVDISFKKKLDFTLDIGHIFENIVFLELRRRFKNIYYLKNKHEVDFYIPENSLLINVSYDVSTGSTFKREITGLVEWMSILSIDKSVLITAEEEAIEQIDNKKIVIVPLWKWLLL